MDRSPILTAFCTVVSSRRDAFAPGAVLHPAPSPEQAPPRATRPALPLALLLAAAVTATARAEPGHRFAALTDADRKAIHAAVPARARVAPQRPRRLLILYRTEGYVHASIPFANEALRQLGEVTGAYRADASEEADSLSAAGLAPYDAVLFNNTTHLTLSPSQRAALLAFVNDGKGMVGIHAASDSFYTWPEGQELLGGIFNSHPWTADDTVAVKLDDPASPLAAAFGGHGFWVRDEIYQIDGPFSRARVRVLLSLDMSRPENARKPEQIVRGDQDFPIAWLKRAGKGRVFYSSLGHNAAIYETREFLQHYLDGIQFALGDLTADATASASAPAQTAALAPAGAAPLGPARTD
jgi:type 1 glutamine amidotransferase